MKFSGAMEFSEVINIRRSVRKFLPEAVPDSIIERALDDALLAPNSSNMQPWEFYWITEPSKKAALVKACLSQPAAATAQVLIVAIARTNTWKRNRKLMLEALSKLEKVPRSAQVYYEKIVPYMYQTGPFNSFGIFKKLISFFAGIFRPFPRGPSTKGDVEEMIIKTTALACENLMLSVFDQGYACCPMEGLDECRVKKILGLGSSARVVMAIGIGRGDPTGIYSDRIRFDRSLFVHKI
ncbi:MAG: nitroreductase family protein [Deltaproteobacteria bacterium CG11_big_fil_rev_8_21_14_0_20_45_16]|nr:MAG: nitroreductase family protein [Deltaproteobacteria bacterium CG11_big_fil_rev_8_21_14_0_20_45_16]